MATPALDLTNVPLAIQRRIEELNKKLSRADEMDNHDDGEITRLRAFIDAVKARMAARQAEFDEFNRERDVLAFAVMAYQDEAPKSLAGYTKAEPAAVENWSEPDEDVVIERVAELAEPEPAAPAAPEPEEAPLALKERVFNAIKEAPEPLGGSAIAAAIGNATYHRVAPVLGVLKAQHRIRPVYVEGEVSPKWTVARA